MKKVTIYQDKKVSVIASKEKSEINYVIEIQGTNYLINLEVDKNGKVNGDYSKAPKAIQKQIDTFISATTNYYFGDIVRIQDVKIGDSINLLRKKDDEILIGRDGYIRDEYCRVSFKYCLTDFYDTNNLRYIKGNTLVYCIK